MPDDDRFTRVLCMRDVSMSDHNSLLIPCFPGLFIASFKIVNAYIRRGYLNIQFARYAFKQCFSSGVRNQHFRLNYQ